MTHRCPDITYDLLHQDKKISRQPRSRQRAHPTPADDQSRPGLLASYKPPPLDNFRRLQSPFTDSSQEFSCQCFSLQLQLAHDRQYLCPHWKSQKYRMDVDIVLSIRSKRHTITPNNVRIMRVSEIIHVGRQPMEECPPLEKFQSHSARGMTEKRLPLSVVHVANRARAARFTRSSALVP